MNKIIKYSDYELNEGIRDKMTPKSEKEISIIKTELIKYISYMVTEHGEKITMKELAVEADEYIVIESDNKREHHIIETLYNDKATVGVYINSLFNKFKFLKEYSIKYDSIDPEVLLDIKELLDNAIDDEILEESVRDQMTPKSKEDIMNNIKNTIEDPQTIYKEGIRENILDVVKYAIEELGADISVVYSEEDAYEINPLELALNQSIYYDDDSIVKYLISKGLDIKKTIKKIIKKIENDDISYRDDDFNKKLIAQAKSLDNSIISKFKKFIMTESLRDEMKPRPSGDVAKSLDNFLFKIKDLAPVEQLFLIRDKGLDDIVGRDVIDNILKQFTSKNITRFDKFVTIRHPNGFRLLFINLENYKMGTTTSDNEEIVTKVLQTML